MVAPVIEKEAFPYIISHFSFAIEPIRAKPKVTSDKERLNEK